MLYHWFSHTRFGTPLCLAAVLEMMACAAVLSDEGDLLVLVDFNSHEYPWFWPFSFPIMKLHYDIKLQIVDTPAGKKFSTQVSVVHLHEGTSTWICAQCCIKPGICINANDSVGNQAMSLALR